MVSTQMSELVDVGAVVGNPVNEVIPVGLSVALVEGTRDIAIDGL